MTSAAATATSGRLIRKIARQETAVTSQPPATGPTTNAIPVQAVQVPIAAPRSSPLKTTVIVASAAGVSSAPATPCSARAKISASALHASAHRSRGQPERAEADQEDPLAAEEVAERAADEDQRAERQEIGVDDPLLEREAAAEVVLDRGQRDVDDRPVDEHDRRPEDAADERQALAHPFAQIARY